MKTVRPITPEEVLDLGDYERSRDHIRNRAMAARSLRRVAVGPHASVMFECRETVRYQIQEMLRAESIDHPEAVAYEIETYSELLPGPYELSATLFLEFEEAKERAKWLSKLAGLEGQVVLTIGDEDIPAKFDPRQIGEERVSAVQFIRFPLTAEARSLLFEGATVRIVLQHPNYRHANQIPRETVRAMASDLAEAEV